MKHVERTLVFCSYLGVTQAVRRVAFILKRKLAPKLRPIYVSPLEQPVPSATAATPLSITTKLSVPIHSEGESYWFRFLNQRRLVQLPAGWRDRDFRSQSQLWGMNLHYMEYLKEVPTSDFMTLVQNWIRANPPYEDEYWLCSWNPYALSIRTVVWMQEGARRALPGEFRIELHRSIAQQLRFLTRNLEEDIRGNHIMKNIKALLWGSAYFEGPEADHWRRLGERLLERELSTQVLNDGMHYERSPSYHAQVFADLLENLQVLGDGPLRRRLNEACSGMAQATADLTHPDGGPALFNDAGLKMAHAPEDCLDLYAQLFRQRPVPRGHIAFPDAGYYGFRKDGDAVLVDCGVMAPDFLMAHAHADILSFEWSIGGHRLIVDQGVFEYSAGRRRNAARSTASHNTVTVGDGEQADFFGAFRCGRRGRGRCLRYETRENGFLLEGTHDGFGYLSGHPRHVRRFNVTAVSIDIFDRVDGGVGQPVVARFLLHPAWQVECRGNTALLSRNDISLQVVASCEIEASPAVWWPDMGHEIETWRLIVTYGVAPCEGQVSFQRLAV